MEWFWNAANSLGVVALAVWAWYGFAYLGDENEQRKANIRKAQSDAMQAQVRSTKAIVRVNKVRDEVALSRNEIVVPLPNTQYNQDLVNDLRAAAQRAVAMRAHPAGKGIVQTTESGVSFVPTEATKGVSE